MSTSKTTIMSTININSNTMIMSDSMCMHTIRIISKRNGNINYKILRRTDNKSVSTHTYTSNIHIDTQSNSHVLESYIEYSY